MWRLMFDFARTTINIAAASASSAAFFTVFWHFARLPSPQHINNITNFPKVLVLAGFDPQWPVLISKVTGFEPGLVSVGFGLVA